MGHEDAAALKLERVFAREIGIMVARQVGDGQPGGGEEVEDLPALLRRALRMTSRAGVERVAVKDDRGRPVEKRAQLLQRSHAA